MICILPGARYTCAHVRHSHASHQWRLQLDALASLPEGSVLELVADDERDELGEAERMALNAALSRAWMSARAGHRRPASDVIESVRKR